MWDAVKVIYIYILSFSIRLLLPAEAQPEPQMCAISARKTIASV